ncbi:YceI family protein [Camelliibacillus cellulosilyticus]|uniref:YceI family protein n=1 Tax=Camelliibacillus cellulosilyticus TaxID=2174486 RepID=A0ABV9GQ02_9BACL
MTKTHWTVDASHSSLDFSVKHMMVSKTKGTFHDFDATIEADPNDLTTANIEFAVDVASVDTRNEGRDHHLRSGDFFDVEKHPKMTFKSTNIERNGDNEYKVTGDLTICGVTNSETFFVTSEGQGIDPFGNVVAGFSGKGKINRGDYGLTYNAVLETGGVIVGDEIKISIEIEAQKAA